MKTDISANEQQSLPQQQRLRAIAYSMDALIPGFYAWYGSISIRLGGSEAEKNYPGKIHIAFLSF